MASVDNQHFMVYYSYLHLSFSMPESIPPKKPFFKTFFGIITLIILTLLGLVVLIFTGFFAYYLWAQKFAPPSTQKSLSEKFNPSFTKAPGLQGASTDTDKNVASFIRPYNPTIGKTAAPITIVAFIDFECPYCHKSYPIFEEVLKKYGSTIRVVFKNFPISVIHKNALSSAIGGTCASEQNKFWPYYHSLFAEPVLSDEIILAQATKLNLNTQKFSDCFEKQKYNKDVTQDLQDGISLGVEGTPTYFVNQQKIEGVLDAAGWDQVLLKEIQKKK